MGVVGKILKGRRNSRLWIPDVPAPLVFTHPATCLYHNIIYRCSRPLAPYFCVLTTDNSTYAQLPSHTHVKSFYFPLLPYFLFFWFACCSFFTTTSLQLVWYTHSQGLTVRMLCVRGGGCTTTKRQGHFHHLGIV
uniref:Uncharacterized protein n=1 Tax=Trypanosoma vivax (strain Y486) TaxID=1055687 RepID=G0TTD3_TRYVY|nr:hypothetical protein, unlikely [Trypanosoma vivax Y486]